MLIGSIGTLHLFLHVVNLQNQDREAVDGPCRTLGVQPGISLQGHLAVVLQEITVNLLHQVGTVLVALVDAAFQGERSSGVNLRVANQVFQMPLHRINPVFQVETVLDGTFGVWITDGAIYVVRLVIVIDSLAEDVNAKIGECWFHKRLGCFFSIFILQIY